MRVLSVLMLVCLIGCGGGGPGDGTRDAFADLVGTWRGTWRNEDGVRNVVASGTAEVVLTAPTINEPIYRGDLTETATGKVWHFATGEGAVPFKDDRGRPVVRFSDSNGNEVGFVMSGSSPFNVTYRSLPLPVLMAIRTEILPLQTIGLARGYIIADLAKVP
jgi:hypothetical protein